MKLHTLVACLAAILLSSAPLHAEIISSGDWSGDEGGGGSSSGSSQSTGAYSGSNGSTPGGWSGGEGWQDLCTTEAGWFNYSLYTYAYAFAEVEIVGGGYAHAYAYASASATSPYQSASGSASAYVSSTGYDWGEFKVSGTFFALVSEVSESPDRTTIGGQLPRPRR